MPACRNPPNMQLFFKTRLYLPAKEVNKTRSDPVSAESATAITASAPARHPIPVVFVVVVVAVSFQHDWEIISRESRGGCTRRWRRRICGEEGRIGAAASGDESESAFTGILFGKGGRRGIHCLQSAISWPSFTSRLSRQKTSLSCIYGVMAGS